MYARPNNEAVQRYNAGLSSAVHHTLDAEAELSRNQLAHRLQRSYLQYALLLWFEQPLRSPTLAAFTHSIGYKADRARHSLLLCTTVKLLYCCSTF